MPLVDGPITLQGILMITITTRLLNAAHRSGQTKGLATTLHMTQDELVYRVSLAV